MIAAIVVLLSDALHHAHELIDPHGRPCNLIHGSLTLKNVMLTYEGHPKVVDFGVARTKSEWQASQDLRARPPLIAATTRNGHAPSQSQSDFGRAGARGEKLDR